MQEEQDNSGKELTRCCEKCSGVLRDENSFARDYGCQKDNCSCHVKFCAPKANEAGEDKEWLENLHYILGNLTEEKWMALLVVLEDRKRSLRQSSFNDGLKRAVECLPNEKEIRTLETHPNIWYHGAEEEDNGYNSALSDARNNILKEIKW